MLHVGEHIYGIVDQVPGVMHVGTRMLHFNFLPCFPLGTVVVVEKGVVGEKTVLKTRFSTRSVAYAFVRLALLWGALVMLMVGVVAFDLQKVARAPNAPFWAQSLAYWMLGLSAVSLLAWWFSHRWTYASYQRAIQWADLIGLDRAIVDDNFRRRGMTIGDEPLAVVPMLAAEEKDDVYRLE